MPSSVPTSVPTSNPSSQPSSTPSQYPSLSPSVDPLIEINPPEPLDNGKFGTSIAVSADKIYVSAYGNGPGAVYIFDHFGVYQSTLTATDGVFGDEFGKSIAVFGDNVVIGAPKSDNRNGAVYHFSSGSFVRKLIASDAATSVQQQFGGSVDFSGGKIVIGASKANFEQGSVYIFNAETFSEDTKIQHENPNFFDNFGIVVAISGERIYVGAERASSNFAGAVYIFDLNGNSIMNIPGVSTGDFFGSSLSVNGSILLIGSPRRSNNGVVSGSASIYSLDDANVMTSATLVAEVFPSDGSAGSNFGASTFVQSNRLYVGADQSWNGGLGKVYRYDSNGIEIGSIVHLDGVVGDLDKFGYVIAANDNLVITSAISQDNVGLESSGKVYILRYSSLL